MGPCIVNRI